MCEYELYVQMICSSSYWCSGDDRQQCQQSKSVHLPVQTISYTLGGSLRSLMERVADRITKIYACHAICLHISAEQNCTTYKKATHYDHAQVYHDQPNTHTFITCTHSSACTQIRKETREITVYHV